jgi:diguanylate cyclase (GGDEF)-like protein
METWDTDFQKLRERYLELTREKLREIGDSLNRLESVPGDGAAMRVLEHLFHNLAGSGKTYGFPGATDVARRGEETAKVLLRKRAPCSPEDLAEFRQLAARLQTVFFSDPPAAVGPPAAGHGAPAILVVEADDGLRASMVELLATSRMTARGVPSKADALRLLEDRLPDGLVVDARLPDPSGYDLVERVRNMPGGDKPVILIVSGKSGFLDKVEAIRCGADGFFESPIENDLLRQRMELLLERQRAATPRILSVEDDPEQAAMLTAVLQSAGYDVRVCRDPKRFEADVHEFVPDLVLMDVQLPEMSGFELARFLRQDDRFASVQIVFLTVHDQIQGRMEAIRAGGDDYLVKPVEPGVILSCVAARLERTRLLQGLLKRDGLTRLLTHTAFFENARTILSGKRRKDQASPVLAMLDIDNFKEINDRWGHPAGDRVLSALAHFLRRRLRVTDTIGRYGGDEFAVILQDLPEEGVVRLLSRLLAEFSAIEHAAPDETSFRVTFSAGVATLDRDVMNLEKWIQAADGALYVAKAVGTDRIVAASSLRNRPAPAIDQARIAARESRAAVAGARVLLLDDEESIRNALAALLTAGGMRVVAAESGPEALEKLTSFVPEIIIADVRMPGMDGYEFCRQVRAAGHDDIPFLFCSRFGALPERITGLRLGADDYLVKPIDPEELILKTRRLIEKGRQLRALRLRTDERNEAVVMAGELGEIGVPELLQIFDLRGRGDVCIRLDSPPGGEIYLSERNLLHASTGSIIGEKAFFRMLAWNGGSFQAEKKSYTGERTLKGAIQDSLLKGVTQLDEYRLMLDNLRSRGTALRLQYSSQLTMLRLEETTQTVLALIEDHHDIDRILDASPLTDIITLRILLQLLQVGVLAFPSPTEMADWWVAQ